MDRERPLNAAEQAAGTLDALRQAVRRQPDDVESRQALAMAAVRLGGVEAASELFETPRPGDDPDLMAALFETDIRANRLEKTRAFLPGFLERHPAFRARFVALGATLADTQESAAFLCADLEVEAALAAGDFSGASSTLRAFTSRFPNCVPALLRLVEVCVDGGFQSAMYEAQARLADAYLNAGRAAEARLILEDLMAHEPDVAAHLARYREATRMLESDADAPAAVAAQPRPSDPENPDSLLERASVRGSVPPVDNLGAHLESRSTPDSLEAGEIDLTGALHGLEPSAEGAGRRSEQAGSRADGQAARDNVEDVEAAAQHLKLGRTYVEVQMMDEAIAPLTTAARSPRCRFEAASLLGRLYLGRGDKRRAIEWLTRASDTPAPTIEEGRALLYDLAVLLDTVGDNGRALALFRQLEAAVGDYRDVRSRIHRLSRVHSGG